MKRKFGETEKKDDKRQTIVLFPEQKHMNARYTRNFLQDELFLPLKQMLFAKFIETTEYKKTWDPLEQKRQDKTITKEEVKQQALVEEKMYFVPPKFMKGRMAVETRFSAGPRITYTYSRHTHPAKSLEEIMQRCIDFLNVTLKLKLKLNGVLENLYRLFKQILKKPKKDSHLGKHKDSDIEMGYHCNIISLSLGAARIFQFFADSDPSTPLNILLENNSLIEMTHPTNLYFSHCVKPRPTSQIKRHLSDQTWNKDPYAGVRINLTFRAFIFSRHTDFPKLEIKIKDWNLQSTLDQFFTKLTPAKKANITSDAWRGNETCAEKELLFDCINAFYKGDIKAQAQLTATEMRELVYVTDGSSSIDFLLGKRRSGLGLNMLGIALMETRKMIIDGTF